MKKNNYPKISIIIPLQKVTEQFHECLHHCLELDYPDYEILVVPDSQIKVNYPNIQVIYTGQEQTGPAEKRDIAIKQCNGEIVALIDDDVYPSKNWLKEAVRNFADPEVAAVGGPAVTPDKDDVMQKASGLVYSSKLVSGEYTYRYIKGARKEVEDFPSCNLIVRKNIFEQLGGFNTSFWPGEDTVLCLGITEKLRKKIIYEPEALVYHHRRRLFKEHLKQVSSYAKHRGYFVKRFPQTSKKFSYFVPSLLVAGIVTGAFFMGLCAFFRSAYFIILGIYLISVAFETVKFRNLLVFPGIISTHFAYGIFFIRGLLSGKLEEE